MPLPTGKEPPPTPPTYDVRHIARCPTCCWMCERRHGWKAPEFEPRRLQNLPKRPKGCPKDNYPCSILPTDARCPHENCGVCTGFKKNVVF